MKKIILSLMVVLCATYANAQYDNFLIGSTGFISDPTLGKTVHFSDGSWFRGILDANGKPQSGTYQLASGDVYVGHMSNMMRHGLGVYTFKNGNWTMCEWRNNVPSGNASSYDAATGKYFDQVWSNGNLISSKEVSRPSYNKEVFSYQFVSDAPMNNSNNSSSSQGYQRSNTVSRSDCKVCNGTGRIKRSVPITSAFGTKTHYKYCNECGETMGASRHIHINCPHCR